MTLKSHTFARVRLLPEAEQPAEEGRYDWLAEISNNRLDAYFGRMDADTTLRNFAEDASDGVAFLEAHRHMTLPFGRSYDAALHPGEITRVESRFYTYRGLTLPSGMSSDEFILRVQTGIQQDVSVGFSGGRFRCDVCGGNLMKWSECPHIPGWEYEESDPTTNRIRSIMATFTVLNARLSEVSAVYDGATPGATIRKAEVGAVEGRLHLKQRQFLENQYRIRLPDPEHVWQGVDMPGANGKKPRGRATPEKPSYLIGETIREVIIGPAGEEEAPAPAPAKTGEPVGLAAGEAEPEAEPAAGEPEAGQGEPEAGTDIRALTAALDQAGAPQDLLLAERLRWLAGEVSRLRLLAQEGQAYREELIATTLAEGVRAYGAGFNEEMYRNLLEAAPLETVRQMQKDFAQLARERLPEGRQTVDTDDQVIEEAEPVQFRIDPPMDVYRT